MVESSKKVYAMKLFILGFFLSAILPATALANYCREQTRSIVEREQCEEAHIRSGIYIAGDWSIRDETLEDGSLLKTAKNRPLTYTRGALDPANTKELHFFCLGDIPALSIFTGGTLKRDSIISYKFENEEYREMSEDLSYRIFHESYIGVTNYKFINDVFSRSLLAVRVEMDDGAIVEYFYTLGGGEKARKQFSCI